MNEIKPVFVWEVDSEHFNEIFKSENGKPFRAAITNSPLDVLWSSKGPQQLVKLSKGLPHEVHDFQTHAVVRC